MDCVEGMKQLPDNSIDAIVTDPPYGLEFMGKEWDKFKDNKNIAGGAFQKFSYNWGKEAIRVMKAGAWLLAFGGTRTYHRLVCGLEDAGFEIKDTIMWLYGSGFPKSYNIGKALDKKLGNWEGYGTALKPACEPIVVAQKPREGTYVNNIQKWGVGGINIDGCRVGTEIMINKPAGNKKGGISLNMSVAGMPQDAKTTISKGRFPANIILDKEAGKMLDEQEHSNDASRFFYCPKASKSERNVGLDDIKPKTTDDGRKVVFDRTHQRGATKRKNFHPTVKPIDLMRYLVRLVAPPKRGIILDPFIGSGTTAIACHKEGHDWVGYEKNEEYIQIAEGRIAHWTKVNCGELGYDRDMSDGQRYNMMGNAVTVNVIEAIGERILEVTTNESA